jgi:flagellar basal body-associated protein FliL
MKRALLIIIPILLVLSLISLIVFWAVNSHIEYKAQMEAKEAHKKRIEKNVISAVTNLIKK